MVATGDVPAIGPGLGHAPAAAPIHWSATGPSDAPAVVFLHGTRLTRRQWDAQVRLLSPRWRCVAVDLPGHGSRADEAFTMAGAAASVVEAINGAAASGRAVLVGLSLGGYVAMETAARYPDCVRGLVLAGCSADPVGPASVPFRSLAWILEHAPRRLIDVANVAFFRVRYRRRLADPILAGGFWPDGGAQALHQLIGRRFLERLERLWTPVIVVNGAFDPVFGPGGSTWAAACRRGREVTIPRASHLSNLDRPRTFAGVVDAFLRELQAPG